MFSEPKNMDDMLVKLIAAIQATVTMLITRGIQLGENGMNTNIMGELSSHLIGMLIMVSFDNPTSKMKEIDKEITLIMTLFHKQDEDGNKPTPEELINEIENIMKRV